MADTVRTLPAILALFADNTTGDISPQDLRDYVVTVDSLYDPIGATVAWSRLTSVPSTFAPSAHTHDASDIVSGVIAMARLATGTPDGTKFIRDDGTLVTPAGGAVSSVFGRTGAVVNVSGDYAVGDVTGAAPLASPALTGIPTAPTPTSSDNTTKIATTAYVKTNLSNLLTNTALIGTPTCPTASLDTRNTTIANTNFATAAANPSFTALTDGATITIAASQRAKQNFTVTISGNRTLVITTPSNAVHIDILVTQDGTGSRTLTLPAGSKVFGTGGGSTLTLSSAAGATDLLEGIYDGSNWWWRVTLA